MGMVGGRCTAVRLRLGACVGGVGSCHTISGEICGSCCMPLSGMRLAADTSKVRLPTPSTSATHPAADLYFRNVNGPSALIFIFLGCLRLNSTLSPCLNIIRGSWLDSLLFFWYYCTTYKSFFCSLRVTSPFSSSQNHPCAVSSALSSSAVGSLKLGSDAVSSSLSAHCGCYLNTSSKGDLPVTAPGSMRSVRSTSGSTWYHSAPGIAVHMRLMPWRNMRL